KENRIQTVVELAQALAPLGPKNAAEALDRISHQNAIAPLPVKAEAATEIARVSESPPQGIAGMPIRVLLLAALGAGLFAALLTLLALSLRGPKPKANGTETPQVTAPATSHQ